MSASIAVIAVTKGGAIQARRLAAMLPDGVIYLPSKWCAQESSGEAHLYDCSLGDLVADLFPRYRFLIFFAAAGLVVRVIAPCLHEKRSDPGILVIDERASHVISLLAGHAGGANQLARVVASLLEAVPVITTASDAQGVLALDLLGREEGWVLEREGALTETMAALVNGVPVAVVQEAGEKDWQIREDVPGNVTIVDSLDAYIREVGERNAVPVILITDRLLSLESPLLARAVLYRPKSLVVGVGCERGVTLEEMEAAIKDTMAGHGLAFSSIRNLATVTLKQDEAALMALAVKYHLPIRYYSPAELRSVNTAPNPSAEVECAIGVPGVCEPAALLSAGVTHLVVPKVKCSRVTVAVARWTPGTAAAQDTSEHRGALYLVGIGPGGAQDMTWRARSVIKQADVVIGYRLYLDLVKELLGGKELIPSDLGEEWARATCAIDVAARGQRVALLSSGDSGVYGMAGPVYEQLYERGWRPGGSFAVEVVPGITAASSCAALLGAPLMHDFVVISLSDRLTPWTVIQDRLEAAARADFVVVLYNPRSERRQRQLLEAQRILLTHKSPQTPVGVITQGGREGESVRIATVETFITLEIGMFTTIIVGNAETLATEDFMVTRRGYDSSTVRDKQNDERLETVPNKEARR
jgi:cobalt-precorrin 5A hydrolase / cobalt-factor III methyltransferase / precorrin-3B C17-methyltransferase